jgi:D-sedoheptulose 7-phosphate isomerase
LTKDIKEYFNNFYSALTSISTNEVDSAIQILETAYQSRGTIYVIGNGQSAASASAFALDLTKQTAPEPPKHRFRVISLTDNSSAITAWGNDVDYESIFTEQLKSLWGTGDILLAVSASGNSPNVISACQWVHQNKGQVIGLTGFEGGKLRSVSDACIVVHSTDYGFIETAHIAIMHYWVTVFHARLASSS